MGTMYTPTIGLEIHAELKTQSKMFCGCTNDPDENSPNVHICPICMAHPGTLPVINKSAVLHVLRVGTAVGGTRADFTEFDRKNYFYPDIPKNYQISQYKYPLISGGEIEGVAITRIHLEEDTARSVHRAETSLVDFNRAGVPLMELVTEPVIHDAKTAVSFARNLRLLLRYLKASDANLEKGEMRVEANISLSKDNSLGTKVEVKNLNSFKAVELAIAYEIARQSALLSQGQPVVQETRGWDEAKQKTFSQRMKEESHDYRYFPDPDLPKLYLSEVDEFDIKNIKESLPTLPWVQKEQYIRDSGIQEQQALQIVASTELNALFLRVCALCPEKKKRILAANYLTSDLQGLYASTEGLRTPEDLDAGEFVELIDLVADGSVSSRGAKDLLLMWVEKGGRPRDIAESAHLIQVSDSGVLDDVVLKVIMEHASVAEEYRGGKEAALQFLVGQCMKMSKGSANPSILRDILIEKLSI